MMKHSSRRFGDLFSGFGRQSEKFSCIGACIRCNLDRICLREIFFLLSNELNIEPLENMYSMYVWRKSRQLLVIEF